MALAISLAFWDPLEADERARIRRLTAHSAQSIRADLLADVQTRLLGYQQLAGWLAGPTALSAEDRELGVKLFLKLHPACLAVRWLDPALATQWEIPRDPSVARELADDRRTQELRALVSATESGSDDVVISPAVRLADGRHGVHVVVAARQGGRRVGFLIGVVDVEAGLEHILADHTSIGWAVSVRQGEETLYESQRPPQFANEWSEEVAALRPGVVWQLRVWPSRDLIAEMRSSVPELALVLATLLVVLLSLTVLYLRAARQRSAEAIRAREEVEERVVERTRALQVANTTLEAVVAERIRVEEELRRLSGRLMRLQDDERRHIARELHDSTAQLLGAVAIDLEQADRLARDGQTAESLRGLIRQSTGHLARVSQQIRTLSFLLHPPILDDLGLEYALPWYVKGFSERSGIQVTVDLPCDLCRLPGDVELALFRITQEALSNVHRHSGSSRATLRLVCDKEQVKLEISDLGHGLPDGVLDRAGGAGRIGVGIAGMEERVRQLGGRLEIATGPAGGATVRAVLPASGPAGHCRRCAAGLDAGPPTRVESAPARRAEDGGPRGLMGV